MSPSCAPNLMLVLTTTWSSASLGTWILTLSRLCSRPISANVSILEPSWVSL